MFDNLTSMKMSSHNLDLYRLYEIFILSTVELFSTYFH